MKDKEINYLSKIIKNVCHNELQVNLNNEIWNLTKGKILNEYDMQYIISINTIKFKNIEELSWI